MREVIPPERPEPSPKMLEHTRHVEAQIGVARIVLALLAFLLLGFLCAIARLPSR